MQLYCNGWCNGKYLNCNGTILNPYLCVHHCAISSSWKHLVPQKSHKVGQHSGPRAQISHKLSLVAFVRCLSNNVFHHCVSLQIILPRGWKVALVTCVRLLPIPWLSILHPSFLFAFVKLIWAVFFWQKSESLLMWKLLLLTPKKMITKHQWYISRHCLSLKILILSLLQKYTN